MSRLIDAELKPCPFCGGKPEHRTRAGKHSIFCKKCGIEMEHYMAGTGFYKQFESYGHVKTAWNRRIEKRGEWKKGSEFQNNKNFKFVSHCYYCSVCECESYWDTDYGQQLFNFCPNCGADMREAKK